MLYHYLAGIALAMDRQYKEAVEYFEGCVCVPSNGGVSALQVEAARRWYLVQLIWKGKVRPCDYHCGAMVDGMLMVHIGVATPEAHEPSCFEGDEGECVSFVGGDVSGEYEGDGGAVGEGEAYVYFGEL